MDVKESLVTRIKNIFIGRSRNIRDRSIFHKISLIAFFAWIGLGADGISSSCYGPQEAYLALGSHTYLSIFVALGTVITIFVISAGYSQIVELFPTGGGGYLVASKLLSPSVGMISGCALLIDYVLTITVSIASGADAVFSLLPIQWQPYRLTFAIVILLCLIVLNMRGAKESILPLVPIFLLFLVTHAFIILYALLSHMSDAQGVTAAASADIRNSVSQLGFVGVALLILRSYSMGAGTFTGIEAVSNGLPILREPKVETAKRTMKYMAVSLAFIVMGLMLSYIFFQVRLEPGKTLNAVFLERATVTWGKDAAALFIIITLISEAALLFVAAQAGFLGSPRVLANMATDRWFPTRFSTLSDRLVIQNGVLMSGGLALIMMAVSHGSVRFLVVLYSINVFITFVLSQLGMVRHWWLFRKTVKGWMKKMMVNGVGLAMTAFILVSMVVLKFNEGGWLTLVITGLLIMVAMGVKRHYLTIAKQLRRLDTLVIAAAKSSDAVFPKNGSNGHHASPAFDHDSKTAIILVNGYNGMGLHTLLGVMRLFGTSFKNFIFLEVGVLDAGNFKGAHEVESLEAEVKRSVERYVDFTKKSGYYAEGISSLGVNVVDEVTRLAPELSQRFDNAVFFGGQLLFEHDSAISKLFHNYTVFTLQQRLYREGIPFVILPIRV